MFIEIQILITSCIDNIIAILTEFTKTDAQDYEWNQIMSN